MIPGGIYDRNKTAYKRKKDEHCIFHSFYYGLCPELLENALRLPGSR